MTFTSPTTGMKLVSPFQRGTMCQWQWLIVPRWNGDTNFMPVVGEVKVMSQHLEDGFDALRPLFAPLDEAA